MKLLRFAGKLKRHLVAYQVNQLSLHGTSWAPKDINQQQDERCQLLCDSKQQTVFSSDRYVCNIHFQIHSLIIRAGRGQM